MSRDQLWTVAALVLLFIVACAGFWNIGYVAGRRADNVEYVQ